MTSKVKGTEGKSAVARPEEQLLISERCMPAAVWQSTTRLRTGDDNGDEVNTAGNNEKNI